MVAAIAAGPIDPASAAPAGPPDGLDVRVINETTNPVPVTGSLNIGNQVDVNVTNDETNPIPVKVEERAVIPFQLSDTDTIQADEIGFSQAGFDGNPFPAGRVPVGFRAVMTHASLRVCHDGDYGYPAGTTWSLGMRINLTTDEESVFAVQRVGSTPTTFVGPPINFACVTVGTIAQPLNLVMQEEQTFFYSILRNYTGADEDYTVAFQGFLEPVSTP